MMLERNKEKDQRSESKFKLGEEKKFFFEIKENWKKQKKARRKRREIKVKQGDAERGKK